jgi:hypothetical protein
MSTERDVRELALALADTVEKPSYGTPGFRVRDKLFARIAKRGCWSSGARASMKRTS